LKAGAWFRRGRLGIATERPLACSGPIIATERLVRQSRGEIPWHMSFVPEVAGLRTEDPVARCSPSRLTERWDQKTMQHG
jgi:hypothetical protein